MGICMRVFVDLEGRRRSERYAPIMRFRKMCLAAILQWMRL
jgi:hypothetical protein